MYLKIAKIRDVKTPNRGFSTDAGLDLFIPNDFKTVELEPNKNVLIPSGIKMEIPVGYSAIFFNKGGVAGKKELIALNSS